MSTETRCDGAPCFVVIVIADETSRALLTPGRTACATGQRAHLHPFAASPASTPSDAGRSELATASLSVRASRPACDARSRSALLR